eukprot:SAG31_NODE_93_length_26250_cov_47.615082_15_plen_143_part_00
MMPDADCILYCSPMNVDRAQGWHRDFAHWRGDGNHPLGPYSEAAQRERWETLNSSSYWPTPFDPDDPGSGGLFGHNTYIEHNHGAQWVRWELALIDHEVNSGVEYGALNQRIDLAPLLACAQRYSQRYGCKACLHETLHCLR